MKREQEHPAVFAQRFSRSYRLLHLIACRVLGDADRAPLAIRNCWLSASRNPPRFEYEGAFRSWLVRVLIDEALAILRESERAGELGLAAGHVPVEELTQRRDEDDSDRSVLYGV